MSVGGIGNSQSFWQQDQAYWSQQKSSSNSVAATDSVINAIGTAESKLGRGLASIANRTALNRVNSQLSAAIQSLLDGSTSTSSSSSASSASSGSATSTAKPATGVGTAPLTTSTPLWELGVQPGGQITVSAGANTTTYASTGSDTVGDLMLALNNKQYGNAQVTASLNARGDMVITSNNTTDTVTVAGTYASNIGFKPGNRTFKPTGSPATPATTSTTPATTTSTKASTNTAAKKSYTTTSSLMLNSAASVLSDSGAGGSLVDMLS